MAKYRFRNPDYVGFWNGNNGSGSMLMIYINEGFREGKRGIESGKMFDNEGVAEFGAEREDDSLRLRIKYIPSLSNGRSDEIEGEAHIEGDFMNGTWRKGFSRGKFSVTKFGSTFFCCSNPSIQLLSSTEYNKLGAKLSELTRQFPFSPPIPEALEEIE